MLTKNSPDLSTMCILDNKIVANISPLELCTSSNSIDYLKGKVRPKDRPRNIRTPFANFNWLE